MVACAAAHEDRRAVDEGPRQRAGGAVAVAAVVGALDPRDAATTTAIVLAAVTNTMVKAGIALWTGGALLGRAVATTLGAALAAGAAVHIALRLR